MEELKPGHYWKTPFIWEPGLPVPPSPAHLRFEPAPDAWLRSAITTVVAASMDPSDHWASRELGPEGTLRELFALLPQHFTFQPDWWRLARDAEERAVGFVLPALFSDPRTQRDGRPEGTVFYMGVLPGFRGHHYGEALLGESTRILSAAGCWRILCDTGTDNAPMVAAFRRAGYLEWEPWQRPLA